MDPKERRHLVSTWIELHKAPRFSARYDELFWSFTQLDDLVRKDPATAWEIILEILHSDQSDRVYQNLSAGPLEDLLAKHGPEFIDRVEAEVSRDVNFRRLLRGVWQNAMTDEVWHRVQRCSRELATEEKQELANAWIALQKASQSSPEYDKLFWSHTEFYDLVSEDAETAWEVILEILRADKSAIILQNLSFGPLEELLTLHGPEFIDRVERQAAQDPSFREMLSRVWQNAMADEVWQRVQRCCE